MGASSIVLVFILFLILLGFYIFGFIPAYWMLMIAVILIIVGFVIGILILGSESESMWVGIPMLFFGIILLLIIYFFPK